MPSPAIPKASTRSILRRFRRNRAGSAAVEFALVAPMFFALLFAIIETGIMFFANQVLETITQNAARQIMTGQAQTAGDTQTQFQAYVCSQIPALFTCANIAIDVESWPAFSGAMAVTSLIDANCNFISNNLQYNPGGPGSIVLVKLAYQWPLFVTGLGFNITSPGCSNKRLLVAAAAFQNEPY
jgi:Flp pilus assembly protein TadG